MTLRDRLGEAKASVGERLSASGGDSMVQEARKRGRRRRIKRRAKEAIPSVPAEMSNREIAAKARSGAATVSSTAASGARRFAQATDASPRDVGGSGFGESSEDVARRAEQAATVADPIGTTLEPASPMGVDDIARGRAGRAEAAEEQPSDGADAAPIPNPLWGVGDGDGGDGADGLLAFGAGGEDGGDPLEFDDPFGLGGDGGGD